MIQCDTNIELKLYMLVSDLYFMVQWFCLIPGRLFDGEMSELEYWIHVMQRLLHKMYVGQLPTFHGLVILSYILETIWWINVVLEILIQCDTNTELKLYNYVGQWPIFHGPMILPYILKTVWLTKTIIIGILDPCDAKINRIKCMKVSDLHFVVQWFLKTFWWRNVVLKIFFQYDIKFDLQLYM